MDFADKIDMMYDDCDIEGFPLDNLEDNKTNKFEFEGIPSGDYESFCWDVDKDTYRRIKMQSYMAKGMTESEAIENFNIYDLLGFSKSYFNKELYRLYPNDLIISKKKQLFTIETKQINKNDE